MPISHAERVVAKSFEGNGAKGVLKKTLLGPKEGWQDYVMRLFELSPGGCSPKHTHPWPHIAFIISGSGTISIDGVEEKVTGDSYAYIPAGTTHQYTNSADSVMRFICIVPPEGDA